MHSRSSGLPSPPKADPLAAIIELLRPQTVLSKIISGAGRWRVRYGAHQDPAFCLLLHGSCFLDAEGVGALKLEEGDFVLFPSTPGFTLASDRGVKPRLVAPTHAEELRHGTKGVAPTMRMLGGYF